MNQIQNNHHILFLGTTLGNHQRECHQGVVSNVLSAVHTVQNTVFSINVQKKYTSFDC